jgi:hypothetical protein
MSTVTGFLNQSPSGCGNVNCGNCPTDNWVSVDSCNDIGQQTCCPVDSSICPVLAGVNPSNVSFTNPGACYNNDSTCQVSCVYPLDAFNNVDAVNDYIGNFTLDNSDYNQVLMPAFCSQQVGTCPLDPITGDSQTGCSRFTSTEDDGTICRAWAGLAANKQWADASMIQYCRNNPNGSECGCINRNSNPVYNSLKVGNPYNDGCWWIPCANIQNFLVPSDLQISAEASAACPQYICEQVVNIYNNSDLSGENISQYINCDFSGATGCPTGPTGPTGCPECPSCPTGPNEGFFDKYRYYIIGLVAGLILLIIVATLIYLIIK